MALVLVQLLVLIQAETGTGVEAVWMEQQEYHSLEPCLEILSWE